MLEKMAREKQEDRRRQIALEARGKQPYRAITSPDVAGHSRDRPASPRGGAPRAISSPSHKYVGTIPKFRDRGSVAQEERARHREACGYRGGVGAGAEARAGGGDLGPEAVLTSPTITALLGQEMPMGTGW